MATPVHENSLEGNMFKKKIAERHSGLTTIPLFFIYVFQVLSIFSTFTGYFCLNHYITEHWCHDVHYSSEQFCGIYIFIFLYLKTSKSIISKTMFCWLDHSASQPFIYLSKFKQTCFIRRCSYTVVGFELRRDSVTCQHSKNKTEVAYDMSTAF